MKGSSIAAAYAPDVTQFPDGRFDFMGEMGVAVCDTPAGQYQFYGKVHHRDGKVWGKKSGEQFPFDPGVLTDDDGRVWLYSGFATKVPFPASRWHDLRNDGGVVMELEREPFRTMPSLKLPPSARWMGNTALCIPASVSAGHIGYCGGVLPFPFLYSHSPGNADAAA